MEHLSVPSDYLPVLLQSLAALGFVAATMVLTHYLGASRRKISTSHKIESFECGIEVHGDARLPFSVQYFLIAILFVLFDVEVIFFYPWAVNFKDLGWDGFWKMMVFLAFLLAGFFYLVKKKAFDWD